MKKGYLSRNVLCQWADGGPDGPEMYAFLPIDQGGPTVPTIRPKTMPSCPDGLYHGVLALGFYNGKMCEVFHICELSRAFGDV